VYDIKQKNDILITEEFAFDEVSETFDDKNQVFFKLP
jgi:hypothetical protein